MLHVNRSARKRAGSCFRVPASLIPLAHLHLHRGCCLAASINNLTPPISPHSAYLSTSSTNSQNHCHIGVFARYTRRDVHQTLLRKFHSLWCAGSDALSSPRRKHHHSCSAEQQNLLPWDLWEYKGIGVVARTTTSGKTESLGRHTPLWLLLRGHQQNYSYGGR
jgi:hypothetical protein